MSLQKSISYTFLKNGIYYYNRLVPVDVRSFYNKTRISFSLKTKSFEKAFKLSDKVSQKWGLREGTCVFGVRYKWVACTLRIKGHYM